MGVTSLTKQKGGAALIQNFKNIFPSQIIKLYIYRGTNLLSKGENVIAREDYQTTIALTLIKTVDVVYGGESFVAATRTIQEEKQIKELTRDVINTSSITAFLRDMGGVDFNDDTLYYTVGGEFIQSNNKSDQLKVMTFDNIIPNVLTKLLTNSASLTQTQINLITNNQSVSFNFTPAILANNLASSKTLFVDGTIYKKIPVDEHDFEINSIKISSDHTFAPEYGNGFKFRGIIETQTVNEELDIDYKIDKPLLPLNINPYAKKGSLQFAIGNFNKFLYMPWLYAKAFLGNNRDIAEYITQGDNSPGSIALVDAVVNMFKLSHAFSTNFSEYRDNNGEVKDEKIGGVALKALENKDAVTAVDAVMKNFEYSYPKEIGSDKYVRALQILAASSQYIASNYCIAKGLSQFNKSLLDFYLELETQINKDTVKIDMSLGSLRYDFTYEELPDGSNDLTKPIINLKPLVNQSKVIVDESDRYISLPELDDPISTSTFVTFAGDINSTNQDSLKYKVGVDITDPSEIAKFLIDEATSNEEVITKEVPVDSIYYIKTIPNTGTPPELTSLIKNQTLNGIEISNDLNPSPEDIIKRSIQIPNGAYEFTIKTVGTEASVTESIKWQVKKYVNFGYGNVPGLPSTSSYNTEIFRLTGAIVSYKIKTITHGAKNKVLTYDKGTFFNMIQTYSLNKNFERLFTISDDYRDDKGKQVVKVKSIDRIYLSYVLGNYVDITINYQYTQTNKIGNGPSSVVSVPVTQTNKIGNGPANAKAVTTNVIVTGSELLPRIDLPSKTDETRTKLGISL